VVGIRPKTTFGATKEPSLLCIDPVNVAASARRGHVIDSNCRFGRFQSKGFAFPHDQPALVECSPLDQKRRSMSGTSTPFFVSSRPSLPQTIRSDQI
jgi:hypothetical protein